jgi:shikimate 5-dehydrogenase
MLVHQAAEQLRDWTGSNPPLEVMAEAFDAAGQPPAIRKYSEG